MEQTIDKTQGMTHISSHRSIYNYIFSPLHKRIHDSHYVLQANPTYEVRKNRSTVAQKRSYDGGMYRYGISSPFVTSATILQEKIYARCKQRYNRLVLDIGFGNGISLLSNCQSFPETLFVGIEVYSSGIGSLLKEVLTLDIDNLLIYNDDALKVLFYEVENESIDAVHVCFPDPWHKKKHNKRRMVTMQFLHLVYQLLIPKKGIFFFISDNTDYVKHVWNTVQTMNTVYGTTHAIRWKHLDKESSRETLYCSWKQSKFEQRALKNGNTVQSLILQRA